MCFIPGHHGIRKNSHVGHADPVLEGGLFHLCDAGQVLIAPPVKWEAVVPAAYVRAGGALEQALVLPLRLRRAP